MFHYLVFCSYQYHYFTHITIYSFTYPNSKHLSSYYSSPLSSTYTSKQYFAQPYTISAPYTTNFPQQNQAKTSFSTPLFDYSMAYIHNLSGLLMELILVKCLQLRSYDIHQLIIFLGLQSRVWAFNDQKVPSSFYFCFLEHNQNFSCHFRCHFRDFRICFSLEDCHFCFEIEFLSLME